MKTLMVMLFVVTGVDKVGGGGCGAFVLLSVVRGGEAGVGCEGWLRWKCFGSRISIDRGC